MISTITKKYMIFQKDTSITEQLLQKKNQYLFIIKIFLELNLRITEIQSMSGLVQLKI